MLLLKGLFLLFLGGILLEIILRIFLRAHQSYQDYVFKSKHDQKGANDDDDSDPDD